MTLLPSSLPSILRPATLRSAALLSALSLGACASSPSQVVKSAANDSGDASQGGEIAQSEAGAEKASATLAPPELLHPRGDRAWLGVELRATSSSVAGVEITRVLPGSPAAAASLRPGDRLISMAEVSANSPQEVAAWVQSQELGSTHPLGIMRGGQQQLLRVTLEGMPDFEDRLRLAFVGKKAPEISGVVTFQGEAASLSDMAGEVVILEFWASFCGVCRFLAPVLDGWHREYRPQGAHVFGITTDGAEVGMQVARKTGMSYSLASDPEAKIISKYMASQIPTLMIINRKGIIIDVVVGYSKKRLADTQALIERLLEEAP